MREQCDGNMWCGEGIGRQAARADPGELCLDHGTAQRNPKPREAAPMFMAREQIESRELCVPTRRRIARRVGNLSVAVAVHLLGDWRVPRQPSCEGGDGTGAPRITEHLGEDCVAERSEEQGIEGARRCLCNALWCIRLRRRSGRSARGARRALCDRLGGAESRRGGGRYGGALDEVPSVGCHGQMVTRPAGAREIRDGFPWIARSGDVARDLCIGERSQLNPGQPSSWLVEEARVVVPRLIRTARRTR